MSENTKPQKSIIRVAMVSHDFPLVEGIVDGGVEAAAYYLCASLREIEGIELQIIRPFAPASCRGTFSVAGIQVHPISRPWWQPGFFHAQWFVGMQVTKLVARLSPDLVHVQSHTVAAAALQAKSCILTVHGILEKDVLFRGSFRRLRSIVLGISEKLARLRLRNVIAISPYTREFLPSRASLKIWDIANAVPNYFFDIKRAMKPGYVFSASKITERKNVAALIEAFASVTPSVPEARLRLAGSLEDTAYVAHCKKLVADLGIGHQVDFLGTLNIQQILHELASAACFALCSYQENAPLSIGEAMSAGVPVLASNVCGVPFMVDDTVTGRLVDPNQPSSITEALRRMLLEDDLVAMGSAGKIKAERTYRASVVAHQTVEAYREVLSR